MSKFIIGLILLTLTTLPINGSSKAETATSGNLLPNAGAGQSNYQNTTDNLAPDKVGAGQGFTVDSGIQSFTNELEAKGEGIIYDSGTLVGITTTTQSGNSHTTTTTSLDGGVTLESGGGLIFKTQEHGASPMSEKLRITKDGNVGIGTSSQSYTLQVQSDGTSTTAGANVVPRFQSNGSGRDATIQ